MHWAAHRGQQACEELHGGAMVTWHGKRGLHLGETIAFLSSLFRCAGSTPSHILLHVGTNDIESMGKKDIAKDLKDVFEFVRGRGCNIIWSDILPRLHYRGFPDGQQGLVDRKRRSLNRYGKSLSKRLNGFYIGHPDITYTARELFRPDGVHLSNAGTYLFLRDIAKGFREAFK